MQQSVAVTNDTNQPMASHFSDVMWALEQVLLEHAVSEGFGELSLTHEAIANG